MPGGGAGRVGVGAEKLFNIVTRSLKRKGKKSMNR